VEVEVEAAAVPAVAAAAVEAAAVPAVEAAAVPAAVEEEAVPAVEEEAVPAAVEAAAVPAVAAGLPRGMATRPWRPRRLYSRAACWARRHRLRWTRQYRLVKGHSAARCPA